jgi:hypothetical protein
MAIHGWVDEFLFHSNGRMSQYQLAYYVFQKLCNINEYGAKTYVISAY